jgi:hypothetical protein
VPVVVTEEWPKGSGRLGGANATEGYEEAFAEVRKTPAGRRLQLSTWTIREEDGPPIQYQHEPHPAASGSGEA